MRAVQYSLPGALRDADRDEITSATWPSQPLTAGHALTPRPDLTAAPCFRLAHDFGDSFTSVEHLLLALEKDPTVRWDRARGAVLVRWGRLVTARGTGRH